VKKNPESGVPDSGAVEGSASPASGRSIPCICDGKKHWRVIDGDKLLRTNWKVNPYCKAHEDETKTTD
jgi:hypothetical protein